jgi:hypothetical protein
LTATFECVEWLWMGWHFEKGGFMRRILMGLAVAVFCAVPVCRAASPELLPGFKVQAAEAEIDDHNLGHFVPAVVDWNGDGKKDMIVGSFTGDPGNVRLFINIGTDAEPKFGKATFLEASGQPIKLTGG